MAHELEQVIDKYQRLYEAPDPEEYARTHGIEPISDYEYDVMVRKLQDHYAQNPQNRPAKGQSVLDRVGVLPEENTFNVVVHEVPMLSLDKAMNKQELRDWFCKMHKEHGVFWFSGDQKIDGFATELVYVDGVFTQASTRGSGVKGEDITATISRLTTIPKHIEASGKVLARGEFHMTKEGLEKANEYRVNVLKKEEYHNVRNGVSGLLRNKDASIIQGDEAHFKAYGLIADDKVRGGGFNAAMVFLKSQGFTTVDTRMFTYSTDQQEDVHWAEIERFIDEWEAKRSDLGYDIDGLVFRVNDFDTQELIGEDEHEPKWAIAYKFDAVHKETPLNDVVWTYGDKGTLTPNAHFDPIDLVGAMTAKCTLHNIEEIENLGIMIGDTIVVERRGDVIPKVVALAKKGDIRTPIEPPTHCPACGAPTVRRGPYIRCSDPDNCTGYFFGRVKSFINALEIEEFGPGTIQKAIDADLIKDPADIFNLTVDDIAGLDRLGKKQATKIVNNVQAAKEMPLANIVAAVGIRNVSVSTGKLLANKYKSLSNMLNCSKEELRALDGVGETMSQVIYDWFHNPENIALINKMISLGVGLQDTKKETASEKLANMSFCFTGTLSQSRPYFEKLVEDNGGTIASVKKGLTYLVAGDKAGSKLEKATKLGVTILDEMGFMDLLK